MKRAKMSNKDFADASSALVDWLQSQDISPEDAPRVLTVVLVGVIASLAIKHNRDAKAGSEIVAKMITEAFQ